MFKGPVIFTHTCECQCDLLVARALSVHQFAFGILGLIEIYGHVYGMVPSLFNAKLKQLIDRTRTIEASPDQVPRRRTHPEHLESKRWFTA